MPDEDYLPTGQASPYSVAEIGRNLSDIKSELRTQREATSHMSEKITAIPTQLALMEERQKQLVQRVERLESDDKKRSENETANRKWQVSSILMPIVVLISSPIVALIIAGSLK